MTEMSYTIDSSSLERSSMIEGQEALNRPGGMWAVLLAVAEYLDGAMREAIDHYSNKMIALDKHTINVNTQAQEVYEEHTRALEELQKEVDALDPEDENYADDLQALNVKIMEQQAKFEQDQAFYSGATSITENLSLKASNEPSRYIQEQSKLIEVMDRVITQAFKGSFQAANTIR